MPSIARCLSKACILERAIASGDPSADFGAPSNREGSPSTDTEDRSRPAAGPTGASRSLELHILRDALDSPGASTARDSRGTDHLSVRSISNGRRHQEARLNDGLQPEAPDHLSNLRTLDVVLNIETEAPLTHTRPATSGRPPSDPRLPHPWWRRPSGPSRDLATPRPHRIHSPAVPSTEERVRHSRPEVSRVHPQPTINRPDLGEPVRSTLLRSLTHRPPGAHRPQRALRGRFAPHRPTLSGYSRCPQRLA